jgi:hypothetical protein
LLNHHAYKYLKNPKNVNPKNHFFEISRYLFAVTGVSTDSRKIKIPMKICDNCKNPFSTTAIVDGKKKYLHQRRFCLVCSPPGKKNTKDITKYPPARILNGVLHKTCRGQCKRELPYIEEHFYTNSKWGKNRALCKQCSRISKNRRVTQVKFDLVKEHGGKCKRCGYHRYIGALDFHHLNPNEKVREVSQIQNIDEAREECKKCELLCRNCHAEAHALELRGDLPEGFVQADPWKSCYYNEKTGEVVRTGFLAQNGSPGIVGTIQWNVKPPID